MGIYIQSFCARSEKLSTEPQTRLIESARRWAKNEGLEDLFFAVSGETPPAAHIIICPQADFITFTIGPSRIDFGIKTSTAGPRFHAAVVSLCDHMADELDLDWRWDAGGDGAQYATVRNYSTLASAFLDQLRGHMDVWSARAPDIAFAMNLTSGLGGNAIGTIATPLGERNIRDLLETANTPDHELTAVASTLYPWWCDVKDARFWIECLRSLLWAEVEWRRPDTDYERYIHAAAFASAMQIAKRKVACPADLEQALAQLRASIEQDRPVEGEIGYRRRTRTTDLSDYWRVIAPGHYRNTSERNGETTCLSTSEEELRFTPLRFRPSGAENDLWLQKLQQSPDQHASTHRFRIDTNASKTRDGWGYLALGACLSLAEDGDIRLMIVSMTSQLEPPELIARLQSVFHDISFQEPPSLPDKALDA